MAVVIEEFLSGKLSVSDIETNEVLVKVDNKVKSVIFFFDLYHKNGRHHEQYLKTQLIGDWTLH